MPSCLPFPRNHIVGHATSRTAVSDQSSRRSRITISVLMMLMILGSMLCAEAAAPQGGCDAVSKFKAVTRARIAEAKSTMPIAVGNLHALVVGVSQYANPRLNLHFAAKDATDFANFLKTQRQIFKQTYVKLLADQEATKLAIETYLARELPKAGKDDTVVLFFSGHGMGNPNRPGEFYFLPYNAQQDNIEPTSVEMGTLSFLRNADCQRIVIIADACHSGIVSQVSVKSPEDALKTFMREFEESRGRVILTSCMPGQYSFDTPPSGVNLGNSVFTYYLLKGLRGDADENRDFIVSLREAYNYAYAKTNEETSGQQKPGFEGKLVGVFPFAVISPQENPVKADVKFFAQNPRCADYDCIDPPGGDFQCTDTNCGSVSITEGCTMYTGQNYQIAVRPNERSYVYVFQVDGHDQVYKLFPGTDYMPPGAVTVNPLEGGKVHWFPSIDGWLHHGELEGREKIIVVVSKGQNAQLEALYKDLDDFRARGGEPNRGEQLNGDMNRQLDRMMAPTVTKSIKRRTQMLTGGGPAAEKLHTFDQLATALESAGLDVVTSVSFWVRKR